MNLIQICNITKKFNTKTALNNLSFTIKAGEIWSLLGINGAGKTTLSSIIASLCPATSGDILYKNQSIYKDIPSYRMNIGYCPQSSNLNGKLTLKENLIQAGRYYDMDEKNLTIRLNQLVKQFDLQDYLESKPDILSGGFIQRFLLARSLIHNPSLIILDEPTVALDPHIRHQLWNIIKELKKSGVTVLLTTHYLDEAEALSDYVCVLNQGEIVVIDTPENLKKRYQKARLEDVFLQLMQKSE